MFISESEIDDEERVRFGIMAPDNFAKLKGPEQDTDEIGDTAAASFMGSDEYDGDDEKDRESSVRFVLISLSDSLSNDKHAYLL
jgi:hypothetical protein